MSIIDPITRYADELADLADELDRTVRNLATIAAIDYADLELALDNAESTLDACLSITHRDAAARLFDSEIYFWRRQRDKAAQKMKEPAGDGSHAGKAAARRAGLQFGHACEQIAELESAKADMLAGYDMGEVA